MERETRPDDTDHCGEENVDLGFVIHKVLLNLVKQQQLLYTELGAAELP